MSRLPFAQTLVVFVCLALAACASPMSRLVDERAGDTPHAVFVRTFSSTPNHTHRIITSGNSGIPVTIAVHELGNRSNPTIVFIHGIFSDHESWRFLGGELLSNFHLVLIDLPGCGESDKPDPDSLGTHASDVYSPAAMALRVHQSLDTYFATLAPEKREQPLILVAHSLGGLVAVHMLSAANRNDTARALASRVDRLVLVAPLDCCVAQPSPIFLKLEKLSGLDVALGDTLGVLPRQVAESISNGVVEPQHAFASEAQRRIDILSNASTRRAMQAMLRYAIPLKAEALSFSPDWEAIGHTTASYTDVGTRTLIIVGERDDTLPVSMSYKVWAQLPRAELRVFACAKHSPQIEHPALCARLIREFVDPASTIALEPKKNPAVFMTPSN